MVSELISVRQLPVIEERLKELSDQIDTEVSEAMALAATEDTVKSVKAARAAMNKDFAELETQRKQVKAAILEPYNKFEEIYKQYVSSKYKGADAALKGKIDAVEDGLRKEREDELRSFFTELCAANHVEWLTYSRCPVRVTLSKSKAALHDEVAQFVCKIADDLHCIETHEFRDEITVEYKKSLRMADAIDAVLERHAALEREQEEKAKKDAVEAAEEAAVEQVDEIIEAIAPPVEVKEAPPAEPDDDPVATLRFAVTDKISMLRALKKFLVDGGYHYE